MTTHFITERKADSHFVTIANAAMRDARLSYRARGLLAAALTHGPGFSLTRAWIDSHGTEGRDAITSAIGELRQFGYVTDAYEGGGSHPLRKTLRWSDQPCPTENQEDGAKQADSQSDGKPVRLKTRRTENPSDIKKTNYQEEQLEEEQEEPPLRGVQGGKGKTKAKPDPFRLKQLPPEAVPLELLDCADLLTEFWAVKKGTRSTPVFKRVCRKLLAWTASERQEALERAISSGWGDVFQPQAQAASRPSWAPPETRHPASRVFTAARGFDDQPVTNPVLKGMF